MVTRRGKKQDMRLKSSIKKLYSDYKVELIARWVLGLIFLFAGYQKIFNPEHFAQIIYGYDLFPNSSINLIAVILPWLEIVSGIALVGGIYPRSAALIGNGMLLAFGAAIAVNLLRGHQFNCGCFSLETSDDTSSGWHTLMRDGIYFLIGLQVIFFDQPRRWCLLQSGSIYRNSSVDK